MAKDTNVLDARLVAVRRVHGQRRDSQSDGDPRFDRALTAGDRPKQILVGVRRPVRVLRGATGDPLMCDAGADRAADDPDRRELGERRQVRPPQLVLEGRLRHRGHAGTQQRRQDVEEHRERPPVQRVAGARLEPGGGVRHPLLDLVAADRRAADRPGDLVRERGLPAARGTAHHNQRG
nr:hypothetical protein [Planotetraspora phitsanulokensis]